MVRIALKPIVNSLGIGRARDRRGVANHDASRRAGRLARPAEVPRSGFFSPRPQGASVP